ncbi:MAG: hypothetical protein SFU91_13695 [Chloroherpetonaceae bacterium]|nr:hypothetical protein [Chloroherpetonaceae bacterium]
MRTLISSYTIKHCGLLASMLASIFMSFSSCDSGLEPAGRAPVASDSGFYAGTITFENWPESTDSLLEVVLVVYREAPARNNFLNLTTISDTLILLSQTQGKTSFSFERKLRSGSYPYAVVAQLVSPNLFESSAWRLLAVANPRFDGDSLGTPFTISSNQRTVGIRFNADFTRSLPFPR